MNDITQVGITIAAVNALGAFLKNGADWLPNKYIPTVLLVVGVSAHLAVHGPTVQNAVEGMIAVIGAIGVHSALKNTTQKPTDPPTAP